MKRSERSYARELRESGATLREIAIAMGVSRSTASRWTGDIELSVEAQLDIIRRTRSAGADPRVAAGRSKRKTHARARLERVEDAKRSVRELMLDPIWVAGVVAYWAEGAKTTRKVRFSNSDPRLVRLFVDFAALYLDRRPEQMTCALHLHAGDDEERATRFWSQATRIPRDRFRKPFFKPDGTGHRRVRLPHGVAHVSLSSSSRLFDRLCGWIEGLGELDALARTGDYAAARVASSTGRASDS